MHQTHRFETTKTARFSSLGRPENKHLLLVFHGYGQLAPRFIQKFSDLQEDYYIVAAEGLHRFYVEGFSGKVGASWMSKEDRLTDIADYLNYLDRLAVLIKAEEYDSISLLGFSQGVATAFRWLEHSSLPIDHFLICSGMIPPDVEIPIKLERFKPVRFTYLSGDNDPFRKEEEVRSLILQLKDNHLNFSEIYFSGGHRIDLESIQKALDKK